MQSIAAEVIDDRLPHLDQLEVFKAIQKYQNLFDKNLIHHFDP